jgi:alkylhydroperoxidase family enzyme
VHVSCEPAVSADEQERPVSRIPYPVIENLPESVRRTVEHANLNALRMFAHATPEAFDHFFAFIAVFFTKSKLPADLRQIAVLRAGFVGGSHYVTRQHSGLARDVGLSDAAIAAIRDGGSHPEALTPPQQAVLTFVDEVIRDVRASDASLAEVRRHIDDNQLMDLMMVTGIYMMLSRLIETSGAEVDQHQMGRSYLDMIHN